MSKATSTFEFFPEPSSIPVSRTAPAVWPGVTPEAAKAVVEVLKDNHEKWHIFFNDMGFHNHIAHHILALYAMGASKPTIEAAYKRDVDMQKPAFPSPEKITDENFKEHLGKREFYSSYLNYFRDIIQSKGLSSLLEEYIFAKGMNVDSSRPAEHQPAMLDRFLASLVHPIIHTGYGYEFEMPGLVAEGLAVTAVHPEQSRPLIPASLFDYKPVEAAQGVASKLASTMQSALLIDRTTPAKPNSAGTHAFTIVARILKDRTIKPNDLPEQNIYSFVVKEYGDIIEKYAREWTLDTSDPRQVEAKIAELQWTNTLLYAVAGWRGPGKGKDFHASFFLMHLVTSSLFLPTLVTHISPGSQEALLRSFFATSLGWWVARSRPSLDIAGFFADDTAYPVLAGKQPDPPHWAIPSPSSPIAVTPNPWIVISQQTLHHPDDHLPKLQRALAHYSSLYGRTKAGGEGEAYGWAGTELPGAEKVDGTLFIRAANLTAKRMARNPEAKKEPFWDRDVVQQ